MPSANPYMQDFGGGTGYQERMLDLYGNILPTYSGMYNFMQGGAYGPERILALMGGLGAVPQMQAPSVSRGMDYGRGAMDLASQSAAIQAQNAIQSMQGRPGMSGAALQAMAGNVAQQASAGVGQAGVSGYQQGLGLLQQTNMVNQDALLRERMAQLGLLEGSVNRAFDTSSMLYGGMGGALQQQMGERAAQRAQQRDFWNNLITQNYGQPGRAVSYFGNQ